MNQNQTSKALPGERSTYEYRERTNKHVRATYNLQFTCDAVGGDGEKEGGLLH